MLLLYLKVLICEVAAQANKRHDFQRIVALICRCGDLHWLTFLSGCVQQLHVVTRWAMRASHGRLITGVGLRHPVIVQRLPLINVSTVFVWTLRENSGA